MKLLLDSFDHGKLEMGRTKTLIICKSVHHQNTAKVAQAIADVLGAEVCSPEDVPYERLEDYGLIGLGSGIYFGRFHSELRRWVRRLPNFSPMRRRAFVFSTSGLPFLWRAWHWPLKAKLVKKGFDIVGDFHCGGFDTFGPLWLIGGLNRRRPDSHDLEDAATFAQSQLLALNANETQSLQGPRDAEASEL